MTLAANPQLIERLADLEHEQWALWTAYMLDSLDPILVLEPGAEPIEALGDAKIARLKVEGWRRQIRTPYTALSEPEKDSDREWARKVVMLMQDGWRNSTGYDHADHAFSAYAGFDCVECGAFVALADNEPATCGCPGRVWRLSVAVEVTDQPT